ncbi:uncharacterized, partial [Tachysurus ichikawai]
SSPAECSEDVTVTPFVLIFCWNGSNDFVTDSRGKHLERFCSSPDGVPQDLSQVTTVWLSLVMI